jgi:hypothetical protein
MTKLLRACMALASFALTSALLGSEIDVYVGSGQVLAFQFTGNTSGELFITKLGPNGGSTAFIIISPAGNGWPSSYNYWSGSMYQSGATFSADAPSYQAIISGLTDGTYRIGAYGMGGNLNEYYRHTNGSTAYIYQADNQNGLYADFAFEAY